MKKIDFGNDETFIQNYQELKSSRKMAELYNCSKSAVTKHAQDIGYDYSNNKIIKIVNIPVNEVYQKYLELKSTDKVGKFYNCSGTSVRNYLNSNGYRLENYSSNKLKYITDEEIIAKYEELKNMRKAGEFYNCSGTAIQQRLKKINYNIQNFKKTTYKLSEQDKIDIINSYNKETSTDLAKKYNVSRGMITKIWFDNNLLGKKIVTINTTKIDLTGQKFGKWTVLYPTENRGPSGIIMWYCKCDCGIEREVSGLSLRNGTSLSCGAHYNISKGNEKIKKILQQANIPFELEKKFDDCIDIKHLPFDFYVNNEYLIEYDGIQHFDINSRFDYEYTHKHDLIKNQYCKEHNIPLIRIPYTHFEQLELKDLLLETSQFIENYAD